MNKDNLYLMYQREYVSMVDERNKIIENIEKYPRGTLFIKNNQYYLKYNEKGKTISKYIGSNLSDNEVQSLKHKLQSRKTLKKRLVRLNNEITHIEKVLRKYGD